jgi:hypothetical protein
MQSNLNGWGGGRANIAGEPLLPGESPMSTLSTGFERRGMRRRVSKRFWRAKGDEYRLCPQELHPLLPDLTARPIPPAYWLGWN